MTWQEELRQLDSALAGGDLSANDYRKRRDEILAAASSAQPPSPVIGPPTGPQPVARPGADSTQDGDAASETDSVTGSETDSETDSDAAEVTQVVHVESAEADETQVIDAGTAAGGHGNGERTQVMAAAAPPVSHGQQQAQPPAWTARPPDPAAAPGVFPRQQMAGPAVTPMDAQDLFTSNKAPRGGKPWRVGLVVLVVLALVGGAVWFFALSGDDDPGQTAGDDPQQQTTSAEQPAPEPVDITKIELPGEAAPDTGEMDIQRASELRVIAPAEATLLAGVGVEDLVYSGTIEGDYHYMLYSFKSADPEAAKALTAAVVDVQRQLHFEPTKIEGVPGTVDVSTVTNQQAAGTRGVYTYGDTTILMFVLQVPTGDVDEMRVQFQRAMTAVTDAAPPGE